MVSIIYALVGFIMIVLLFRLVFRLFGANPGNAFVSWIYSLSAPLTAPFAGIFGQPPIVEGAEVAGVFEFATIGRTNVRAGETEIECLVIGGGF